MNSLNDNIILLTDSYKVSHYKQYPPNTEHVYSYFESRGGKFKKTVFFGLQYFLKKYLSGKVVTIEKIEAAKKVFKNHFGDESLFNEAGWRYILEEHGGYLPIMIKAVPEGTVVDVHNVLMTVENTDPKVPWLTNYLETILSQIWYPTTVATESYNIRKLIDFYAEETGDLGLVGFKLHDFGFRGVSSVESAMIGGLAHLLNFMGTDTLASIICAYEYYNAKDCPGFSIPAAEHSTITSWGRENEIEAYRNMLAQYPTGLVAVVSDSYDIYNACENIWGKQLKNMVEKRDGCLVIRPDSGNPTEVILKILNILGDKFGYTVNDKTYKVLNSKVRVIQGDGVDYEAINDILLNMKVGKWSTDNIAFGMGGALLQKLNRDTQKFAFKCSAIKKNGVWNDVYKEPITDSVKNSKRGRLALVKTDKKYNTYTLQEFENLKGINDLRVVFFDGNIISETSFEDCRANVNR